MKNFYTLVTALLLSAVGIAQTQMNLPVTFDDATVNYGLVGFGGAEQATVVVDPTLATNKVGKVIKTNTAELWAGATVTAVAGTVQTGFSSNIPFTATEKKMNVRVWSPHAGIKVRLKVEDKNDVTRSVETEATVTTASGWQTLEFDFGNQAAGTAALNLAFAYNKASIFFNFGVTGAVAGERTYYFDDVKFGPAAGGGGGGGGSTLPILPLDFESATINYAFTDFGGGVTTKVANPQINGINTSANVGKMVKGAGEVYGGSFIALAAPIDFSVNKIFKVKVFSPRVGAKLLLKVENGTDGSINFEREVASTVANAWEDLTFDFSAISTTNQYQKLVFIFDLGTAGNGSANFTWLFDDVRLTTGGGGGSTLPVLPLDFESSTIDYAFTDFGGGATTKVANTQINGINTSANVGKMVKGAGEVYGGSFIALAAPIDFSVNKTFKVKVFSPRVGAKLLLKVENGTDGSINFEKEATSTVANAWEDLTFDYSAISTTNQYQKLVFIFDLGTAGNGSANFTWLFDDVRLTTAGGGGGGLTQMNLPVTFDDATVNYGLVGFGGAEQATVVVDPTLATNKVGKVIKTNTAELWAGATVTAVTGGLQTGFSSNIPFTATEKRMNVRVWSPHAGIQVRLKVEDRNDPTRSVETEATVTTASGWQTLEFNFANQATGTAAMNLAFAYNKASIFFNFGVTGAVAGERTYYFDDVKFGAAAGGGGGGSTLPVLPLDFESSTIDYAFTDFGGGATTKVPNTQISGINTSANVGKMVKGAGEVYGGSFIALAAPINFSVNKTFKVKVFSPRVGAKLLLKVENGTDGSINFEKEATSTVANAWEDLTFDYSAISTTNQYQKLVFIFDLGTAGNGSANFTWLFDDVRLTTAGGGGGGLTQMNLPVTFDDATVNYGLVGFGGAEQATVVVDPTLATNKVGKVIKTNTAELWAGATVTAVTGGLQTGFSSNIPFTATEKRMNVRVWSPHAGIQVRLKVEDRNDPTRSVETEATVTTASGWQTLEFNFANQATGTAAMNLAFAYNKASIFFNFGVTGAVAGERTYYFDDVKFGAAAGGGGGGSTLPVLPLDFESSTIDYAFTDFGGGATTKVANTQINGINTSANVGKMVKGAGEVYGGSFIALAAPIDFSVNKTFKVKVFSPRVGAKLLLKVENGTDGSINFEKEATSTVANAWEDLTFDYSAISTTNQYQKLVFIFDLGTAGNGSANFTWLFDDVRLTTAGGGGGGLTQMNLPVTFDDATVNYGLVGFGGAEQATVVVDPTLATNKVGKVIKTNTAELWAGATVTAVTGGLQTGFSSNIPFTATEKRMNVRVWSPHAGIQVRLKVEDRNDPTRSVETEATVTTASGWQTLEFNFANQATGTAAMNLAFAYNKASIFFNFGVTGAVAGERTYYFDDVKFGAAAGGGGGGSTLPVLPLDFESSTIDYTFTDFGGGATTKVPNTQISGINTSANVGKMVKGAGEVYGGSFIALAAPINFSVNKTFKVKVFSPRVGAKLLLKVENGTDGSINFEKEATSTVANAWEDLTFDYSAISTTNQYQKLVFIFDLGTAGNGSANFTWLFDDVRLTTAGGGGGGLTQMNLPVTFDDATVNYGLVGFGGAEQATVVVDPTLATNKVGKVIKTNTAELWAGATVTAVTGGLQTGFSSNIPFTATEKRMNVRVWSPHAGIQVRLKVEDRNDPTRSVETEATVTTASGWQTLEFNFANQATGTAAMNLAFAYNKASIFFNFGVTGAVAGERTYYFDDMRFGPIPPPAAPAVTPAVTYCQNAIATPLTAMATSGNTLRWYTVATGGTGSATAPTPATTTAGTTNYYVSQVNASSVEGPRSLIVVTVSAAPAAPAVVTPVTLCQGSSSQTLTATPATGNTLSWYTVATGGTAIAAPTPVTTSAGTTSYYVSQANAQGCQSARALLNVIVNARPSAPVLTAAPYTRLVPGLTTTITASAATGTGNTYEWFKNDILLGAQTAGSISVNVNELGTYKLQITNAAGCVNMSNAITISDSTSNRLFVYPNPSSGQFQVRFQSDVNNLQPRTLAVYDGRGSLVFSGRYVMFAAFTPISVDLSNHPDGVYTVYLMDKDGKRLKTERIIISR